MSLEDRLAAVRVSDAPSQRPDTAARCDALLFLRDSLKAGDTIGVLVRHTFPSGALTVDFKHLRDHHAIGIGASVATALGYAYNLPRRGILLEHEAADVLIQDLSSALFGQPDQLKTEWL